MGAKCIEKYRKLKVIMCLFSDELCWILTSFKNGGRDFAETDLAIRRLIAKQFGLCLPEDFKNPITGGDK